MVAYLDSSALTKRSIEEAESDSLDFELERRAAIGEPLVASSLAWVEVTRSLRRRLDLEDPAMVVQLVEIALSGIGEFVVDEAVISLARRLGPSTLRSLDAIHLATAVLVEADVVIAYDERMLEAASELGFATLSPRSQ